MENVRQRSTLNLAKINKFEELLTQSDSQIVIFGATGWLGRECLNLIKKHLKTEMSSRLILVASKSNEIDLGGTKIRVIALEDFSTNTKCDLVIDFSFITQEKMKQMGEKEFVRQNSKLTQKIGNYISEARPAFIYYASSGAADPNFLLNTKNPSKKVYGELKAHAEMKLGQISVKVGSQLLINRIWSITGTQMIEPYKYAIGDFVAQALKNKQIVISSSDQILRSYIDATDLLDTCFNHLLDGNSGLINSGGHKVSLHELASSIYKALGINEMLKPNYVPKESDEDYYSPDLELNNVAINHGIFLQDIDKQIKNTLIAINS
jgi:nucleoside-diphosphate-sugar epimerase